MSTLALLIVGQIAVAPTQGRISISIWAVEGIELYGKQDSRENRDATLSQRSNEIDVSNAPLLWIVQGVYKSGKYGNSTDF